MKMRARAALLLCASNAMARALVSQTRFGSSIASRVDRAVILGREMFVKRDDQLSLLSSPFGSITGNKARKLWSLYHMDPFPATVVSCGGSQSNAMRALALLCQHKGAQFVYLTSRPVSSSLKQDPRGNFKDALQAGMQVVELRERAHMDAVDRAVGMKDLLGIPLPAAAAGDALFVPMGAASPIVEQGVAHLCAELTDFIGQQDPGLPWKVIMASGTGSSALYAARAMVDAEVIAVPCVGDAAYLQSLLMQLDAGDGGRGVYPQIASPVAAPKRSFACVCAEHLAIWKQLTASTGIEFDLIYAPRVFEVLLSLCAPSVPAMHPDALQGLFPAHRLLYYHCGGIEANPSQLQRYHEAGLLSDR